ncbi:Nitrate/nitrite transporter NarK [Mesobacillus persicus]|uniref:Nitrate/nitrite transporter NarK n=1 Tax=Mesobacillus persicus TaxID=930146 RepID=A0A1H7Y1P3_9BACI|nr:MFS transporter [Mesobacillus persicus]SEM39913.1 Nitrate/nitrite transporter NarK [Mesobacillus persicus]
MPRALWLLVIGMAVNATGASFLWPLNTIYIHEHLGKSLTVAGFVLMLNSAATVVGNLIGGHLFDRLGGYKSILIGIGITITALFGLTIWNGWPQYIILLVIVGFGSGIVFPSVFAMAGNVWKEGGRKAFNAIYVAQNLGVAIGSALGGLVASYSFLHIFLANALLYTVFLLIAIFGYRGIQSVSRSQSSVLQEQGPIKNRSKLIALLTLCIGFMLCWVGYSQWASTISAYTVQLGIPLTQYSFLWTVNGALIVLGQPILNRVVKRFEKNLKLQIQIGLVIFIGSFIVLSGAQEFSAFLTAMIILTIGEMFVWPAIPTLADSLAPKGREGFYQGIVNSTATGGRMIGPLLGGILVDTFGMPALFTVLIALFIVAIFTTALYDRQLKKQAGISPLGTEV